MKLTQAQVLHVAKLARLRLEPDEVEKFGEQLSNILGYVEILERVDVSGVEATFHVQEVACPLRPDAARPSQPAEEALANAPARDGTSFAVPKVIDA
jgi:aspartyl-tRNA(Asn)/glutamyl-tRNA(Gln) amidotransferase subunit C